MLQSYSRGRSDSPDQPEFLNWITSFMSLYLSEPLSVSDIAARAGLSASRFSQVFSNRFGRPPHQFLLHLRVQRAQDLLHHTSLTMREISGQCGFSDVHHFAKTFKRLSGQTPGAYRRMTQPPRCAAKRTIIVEAQTDSEPSQTPLRNRRAHSRRAALSAFMPRRASSGHGWKEMGVLNRGKSGSSSCASSSGSLPAARTKATGFAPNSSSGTGTTTASSTPSNRQRASSISSGWMFSPPEIKRLSMRPPTRR